MNSISLRPHFNYLLAQPSDRATELVMRTRRHLIPCHGETTWIEVEFVAWDWAPENNVGAGVEAKIWGKSAVSLSD